MLKIAAHAPMPSASESTAARVKAGRARNMRAAYLKSCHNLFTSNTSSLFSSRRRFSLVPERDHRVHLHRASRRNQAGQKSYERQDERDSKECDGVVISDSEEHTRHKT